MITALYKWAEYKAIKDGISTDPNDFNSIMKKVCFSDWKEEDLEKIYKPIEDLFEDEIYPNYPFFIIENGEKRKCIATEMKHIMSPRKDLLGKAMQSIGGSQFRDKRYLNKILRKVDGKIKVEEIKIQTRSGKEKIQKIIKSYIPKEKLVEFWRNRLLETYFLKGSPSESPIDIICPMCGCSHKFNNLRIEIPINLYVVNITNYTSYMSGKSSFSLCPFCSALLMRTVVEENAPERIYFGGTERAYIYVLPFDPESYKPYEIFQCEKVEKLLKDVTSTRNRKKKFDAIDYILELPIIIHNYLPQSKQGKIKPMLYIAFAEKAGKGETIVSQAIITNLDFLARVGEELKKCNWNKAIWHFKKRLFSFIKEFDRNQKINGYKLIFNFLMRLMKNGEVDFSFLHRVLRKEISMHKNKENMPKLYGYSYLRSFLKAKSEVIKWVK